MARFLLFLAFAVLWPKPAIADAEPRLPRFASLTIENDFFVGFDRHYTNGVQAAFLVDAPSFLSWTGDPQLVVAVGQRLYTPEDKARAIPDPADRPYAAWLYAMADMRIRRREAVDHLTIAAGVVGPSAHGRQAQNGVHDALGMEPARGWDAQLHDEAAFMVGYERAWPALASGSLSGATFDLSPRVGVALGNVLTYASAGTVARCGVSLPSDLPATHISLGPARDGFRGAASKGWYAWLGLDAHAVAHNIFLDGNTSGTSPSVERRPLGVDVQVGVAFVWPNARAGFTVVQRSREFEGQRGPDRFAQLTISFPY